MVLPVYLYGHPVLRKQAVEVPADYPELKKLIDDMWETMYHSDGVGLAAPQIGKSIRLIVLDGSALGDSFPECKDSKMTLVNPVLEVIDDMYIDHVSPIRKSLIRNKLNNIVRGKIRCDYKVKTAPK